MHLQLIGLLFLDQQQKGAEMLIQAAQDEPSSPAPLCMLSFTVFDLLHTNFVLIPL
jgi:hypothetical protein